MPPGIDLRIACYPGRERRLDDPIPADLDAIADEIADGILDDAPDDPVRLFGHSMGAAVAFEVARRLEYERDGMVDRLVLCGRTGPGGERDTRVHALPDDELVAVLGELGGTDATVLADAGLRELVLDVVRADYRIIESYRPDPGARVAADIVAFCGDADPTVSPADVGRWVGATSGRFSLRTLPGDHFFVVGARDRLLAEIAA